MGVIGRWERVNGFSVINCTFCCSTQRYTMGTWETCRGLTAAGPKAVV